MGTSEQTGGGGLPPLTGLRVIEAAFGTSAVGAGLAANLPGFLLADLGAEVTHVRLAEGSTLDQGVHFTRVWDRDKDVVEAAEAAEAVAAVHRLVPTADLLLLTGDECHVEWRGFVQHRLASTNPRLVVARIRPGVTGLGPLPDLELLVQARLGLLTQIRGHRPGPVFGDLTVAAAGAGLAATVGALARLYEREATGSGGWVETSLVDGLAAILPMITGRVEHPSPATGLLWERQGPSETLAYRCGDGEHLQLWFGAKGAYEAFLEHMDEPPSEAGYSADLVSGAMAERSARWEKRFAEHDRSWWLERLAGQPFRCEPVWRPGEALRDAHVRQVGLAVGREDPRVGPTTVLGPVARVAPAGSAAVAYPAGRGPLLSGVRVLDLSAYLAGPVTAWVLAELGADVVKVEPVGGDVHRGMEPMYAAGQRSKRAVALDMKGPGAAGVLERLFRWADVVHHNSRVGLSDRLGYDEASVRAANPGAVYSFASGFGPEGPRARLPANDHLMQALSGIEAAQGGSGQPPTFLVWGAIDVTSGWVSAAAVLAALYARRRSGAGQSVGTSLLGAGLLLKSGAHLVGDDVEAGPVVDEGQTGYGAAYRIYPAGDGAWLALAVSGRAGWDALRRVVGSEDLPEDPPPLRAEPGERQPAEVVLEEAFADGTAAAWVERLRAAGVAAELVAEPDRAGYIATVLDDPVGRQLGRAAGFDWGERGWTEQPGFPARFGPPNRPVPPAFIAALGQHTHDVLDEVGVGLAERTRLAAAGTIRPLAPDPS